MAAEYGCCPGAIVPDGDASESATPTDDYGDYSLTDYLFAADPYAADPYADYFTWVTTEAGNNDDAGNEANADDSSVPDSTADLATLPDPPPPPAALSGNGPGMIEVGANELFIYGISVEVTSAGVQIHGEILHGGSSLSGFTVVFTGAFSGSTTTASDGSFDFVYYGPDSGLVEANASGSGMTSNSYTFFV